MFGAELQLHFTALQRVLSEQVFTQEGRKYVRGDQTSKCSFAYLENPRIGADGLRIKVDARFSGRSGRDFFGRCIGLGGSFDLTITAVPYYKDGALRLREVRVDSRQEGLYVRRVRAGMAESLAKDFQYKLQDDAKTMLEEQRPKTVYTQQVIAFNVSEVRVTNQALVLLLDFVLAVR
jgi:hypothetical protein